MAPLAAEIARARIPVLLRELAPAPDRLETATRLALVCALTVLVAEIYRTPEPALMAYVAFFVIRPDRGTSILTAVAMTLTVSAVLALVLAVAIAVADHPPWRVASMAAISFGLLFLTSASKLRPAGATLALVVAYGLDLLGATPLGEAATRGLLYGWLFVGIPAGVSIAVSLLLAPAPRRLAQRALARRLRLAASRLLEPGAPAGREFARCLREGNAEIMTRLRLAEAERSAPPDDIAALRAATGSTTALLAAVEFVTQADGPALPAGTRAGLARTLTQMAEILEAGGYPVEIEPIAAATPALPPAAAAACATIERALRHFAEPAGAPGSPAAAGFFLPDAFSNPDHWRYALKTTAAAMFCYLLYSLLAWPGIHTCLITCYIVSLGTVAESVEKLSLRIAGCLAGTALGLAAMIFLIPGATEVGALLVIVFFGALAAGWVALGSARISYAGFQMAFAFFLCVVQGASPGFDMVTARDRVIGILIGNAVVYVVSAHCWPVSVGARIDSGIGELLSLLARMLGAADAGQRRAGAAQAYAALGALESDLELAGLEPRSVRPDADWLAARRAVAGALGALAGPLLIAAEQHAGAGFAQRLARLSGRPAPEALAAQGGADPASAAGAALRGVIEHRLRALEDAAAAIGNATRGSHALA